MYVKNKYNIYGKQPIFQISFQYDSILKKHICVLSFEFISLYYQLFGNTHFFNELLLNIYIKIEKHALRLNIQIVRFDTL